MRRPRILAGAFYRANLVDRSLEHPPYESKEKQKNEYQKNNPAVGPVIRPAVRAPPGVDADLFAAVLALFK
jgi:hypothetical protein